MTSKHTVGVKLAAVAVLLVCGVAIVRSEGRVLTPLKLNTQSSTYDQKKVVVRAWLDYGFERRHLLQFSPSERPGSTEDVNDPSCTSIEVPARLASAARKLNHSYVLVSGVFFADLAGERVFLGLCNKSGVRASSIKAAS